MLKWQRKLEAVAAEAGFFSERSSGLLKMKQVKAVKIYCIRYSGIFLLYFFTVFLYCMQGRTGRAFRAFPGRPWRRTQDKCRTLNR